jgi:CHASE2 domain-containing sensor protein
MSRNPISRLPAREALRWLVRLLWLDKLVSLLARIPPSHWLPSAPWRCLTHWPPVARLGIWWARQGKLKRRLPRSLLVGMGISIGLLFLHGHPWLEEKEDAAVDWVMQLQWGTAPTKSAVPFAVLDIDEPTYRSWGEPFHTPRDRLLKLIDYAVRGGAALVVVDVDLSQRGHDPAADAGLRDYLAHYGGPRARPILLVRTFREPLSQEAVSGAPNRPEDVPLPDVRRSFLEEDPDIARSPLIHWGSSLG